MPDREKVIKLFEQYIGEFVPCCSTDDYDLDLFKTVLALLKEQQEEIENLKQTAQSMMEGIVVSTSTFYPCGSCQEFNCDFCKYKDFKRSVKWK